MKGCPLIPKDQGLRLLQEYEAVKEQGTLPSLQVVRNHQVMPLEGEDMRVWLARLARGSSQGMIRSGGFGLGFRKYPTIMC